MLVLVIGRSCCKFETTVDIQKYIYSTEKTC